ncbi:MAG: hypothetical protein NT135_00160 [Candidatus Berkelbacteria bacterium]|nr:hypothetical protein [Candidatus Berkelbacteria bacterium]
MVDFKVKRLINQKLSHLFVIYLILVVLVFFIYPQVAKADALTSLSDTMSRLADSTPTPVNSDHTIKFTTPSGVTDASDTIEITFPAGFSVTSVDVTDIDLHWGPSTGLENSATLAGTADATHWGAYFTGQVLSFDHATDGAFEDIATTSKVVVEIGTNATGGDQQIDNHATAATYTISIGGDFGDTGKIAIVILSDDQVQLTATVDPSITFTLSANSSDFGALLLGSVTNSSPDITLTVGTNAGTGYTVTVRDVGNTTNPGLYNSTANYIIGSTNTAYADGPTTLANGTEGYGLYVLSTTGSPTVASRYNGGTGTQVGGLEVSDTTIISRITSMSANDTATIRHRAAIAAFTAAGSYSDTLTYIATGNF